MKYTKQKQKSKMKKGLSTILFGSVLLFGALLASCSETEGTGEEPAVNGERTLTFMVSSKFEDVDESARSVEEPDTVVRELPNGLVMKAVLEEDRTVESREVETVADGTQVLAIVVNSEQQRVHSVQKVEVDGGNLTVKVPDDRDVYIVFYSYNSTLVPTTDLKPGDEVNNSTIINTAVNTGDGGLDAMLCKTGTITSDNDHLGLLLFDHLFAQIRATLITTHDESLEGDVAVNGLKFSIQGSAMATMHLDGSSSAAGDARIDGAAESAENILSSLSTDYVGIIQNKNSHTTFQLRQVTLTVPIDISTPDGNITLQTTAGLKGGHKYTVKIILACKDNSYIPDGATTDLRAHTYGMVLPNSYDDIARLLNTPLAVFYGTGPQWSQTGVWPGVRTNYMWVLKNDLRSGGLDLFPATPLQNWWMRYLPHDARVTNGVRASGRYELRYLKAARSTVNTLMFQPMYYTQVHTGNGILDLSAYGVEIIFGEYNADGVVSAPHAGAAMALLEPCSPRYWNGYMATDIEKL